LDQTLAHKGLIYSKSFGVTMTMGHLAFIVLIALVAPQVDAWGTSSGALMRGLSAQSRKMDDWWAQFDQLWTAHQKLIAQNPNILCMVPDWEDVLDDLKTAEKKIILVEGGLIAMKEQLKQIRAILESADLGGKSGLHCEKTPTESICIALKALDMDADQKQIKLNREKSEVKNEIIRVETYNCNCKWEEWKNAFGPCTPECGDGTHTETRKILWPHRNDGTKCKDSDATKTEYCTNGCCPVNCAWADWESWESCPKECKAGPNYRERVRKIERQGECISGGGIACVNSDANGKEECNIVAVLNGQIQDKKDKIKALKKLIETYKQKLCEPNPCMNGGVCFEGVCTCAKGWTGVHCKTDDLCTPNPCQNGGACKQGVCTCTGGWKGSRCTEKDVDPGFGFQLGSSSEEKDDRCLAQANCAIPFYYDGVEYDGCTARDLSKAERDAGLTWCSLEVNWRGNHVEGRWGHCAQSGCSGVGCQAEDPCVFPVKYDGKTYDKCTAVDLSSEDIAQGKTWCATQLDNDGQYMSGRWGYCSEGCQK